MVPTPYRRVLTPTAKIRRRPLPTPPPITGDWRPQRIAFVALVSLFSLNTLHGAGLSIDAPASIVAPPAQVGPDPQTISSGDQTMSLQYSGKRGWQLSGEINQNIVEGWESGIRMPALFKFKSITWISGGEIKSTAGISISPDQTMIIAEPGFGKGRFDIIFEVIYEVPALAYADTYHGVIAFTGQE